MNSLIKFEGYVVYPSQWRWHYDMCWHLHFMQLYDTLMFKVCWINYFIFYVICLITLFLWDRTIAIKHKGHYSRSNGQNLTGPRIVDNKSCTKIFGILRYEKLYSWLMNKLQNKLNATKSIIKTKKIKFWCIVGH